MLRILVLYFQGTEELFRKEANLTDVSIDDAQQSDSDVTSVLSAYKSEGDPAQYEKAYSELKKFVEGALDIYKVMLLLTLKLDMFFWYFNSGHQDFLYLRVILQC